MAWRYVYMGYANLGCSYAFGLEYLLKEIEDNMSEDRLPTGCKEWIEISSTEKLRDQFFCAALTGLMSSAEYISIYGSDGQETRRIAVLHAWKLADEALAQRNKSLSEGK